MEFRIVLDTNCLLQILPEASPYHFIWKQIRCGKISLCVNSEILFEYQEVLERKTNNAFAESIVVSIELHPAVFYSTIYYRFNLIEKDPDDNKFVDCAIASGATFLVTEDAHFNVLKNVTFPKVTIVDLDEFMTILTKDYS